MTKKTTRLVTKQDAEIGFRIRQVRQNKKITQVNVARKCGISYQQIQKYELGRNRISAQRLVQIAEILDVDAGALLKPANDKTSAPTIKNVSLRNIDQTAASLWRKIGDERHKYMLVELMDILHDKSQAQPLDTQKHD